MLVFDLISMQYSSEYCHYPKIVGEPLRPEPNFTFFLEHVTEVVVLEKQMCSVAVDKFRVVRINI